MKYYTLCERRNGKWYPQFGDFHRATVEYDRTEWNDTAKTDLLIICTEDNQKAILAGVAKLNK